MYGEAFIFFEHRGSFTNNNAKPTLESRFEVRSSDRGRRRATPATADVRRGSGFISASLCAGVL